jgi:hypothetical protein
MRVMTSIAFSRIPESGEESLIHSTTFGTEGKSIGEEGYLVLGGLHFVKLDSIFVDQRDRHEYKSRSDVNQVSIILRPRLVAPMSTRRIVLLYVAAVIGLWVLLFVVPSLRYRSNITRAHFDRIEAGMTEAEVRNLLGGPPGYYTKRPIAIPRIGPWKFASLWIGDEGVISITWTIEPADQPRRVDHKDFTPFRPLSFAERCGRVFPWW